MLIADVDRQELLDTLEFAKKVIPGATTHKYLKGVLCHIREGFMSVIATDGEVYFAKELECEHDSDWNVLLPLNKFYEYVLEYRTKNVRIKGNNQYILIDDLQLEECEDKFAYPMPPNFETPENEILIPISNTQKNISILYAWLNKEMPFPLDHAYVDDKDSWITVTDGINVQILKQKCLDPSMVTGLYSSKALKVMRDYLGDKNLMEDNKYISVSTHDDWIQLWLLDTSLIYKRKMDVERYVNYKSAVPETYEGHLTISKKEFLNGLNDIKNEFGKLGSKKSTIRIMVEEKEIVIFPSHNPNEQRRIGVKDTYGLEGPYAFTYKYLLKHIRGVRSKIITLKLGTVDEGGINYNIGNFLWLFLHDGQFEIGSVWDLEQIQILVGCGIPPNAETTI